MANRLKFGASISLPRLAPKCCCFIILIYEQRPVRSQHYLHSEIKYLNRVALCLGNKVIPVFWAIVGIT